ncbi:uncharacterized protein BCR38DRAFT_406557 [Pseudomassariella vexata]|uniref:Uncharacterized protein n=1 Tax=Pseudomassariella vexata TaxID=1141098 RepID=A0A1Y2EAQ4_9PEZI|nr:uncharacterized protein BCR38DRAFT_406557 [Pseudomassariella vexata]ORY68639.1 hypothetical protein BCR38DRAFT_406557 [Pseudomassariella vexata]
MTSQSFGRSDTRRDKQYHKHNVYLTIVPELLRNEIPSSGIMGYIVTQPTLAHNGKAILPLQGSPNQEEGSRQCVNAASGVARVIRGTLLRPREGLLRSVVSATRTCPKHQPSKSEANQGILDIADIPLASIRRPPDKLDRSLYLVRFFHEDWVSATLIDQGRSQGPGLADERRNSPINLLEILPSPQCQFCLWHVECLHHVIGDRRGNNNMTGVFVVVGSGTKSITNAVIRVERPGHVGCDMQVWQMGGQRQILKTRELSFQAVVDELPITADVSSAFAAQSALDSVECGRAAAIGWIGPL